MPSKTTEKAVSIDDIGSESSHEASEIPVLMLVIKHTNKRDLKQKVAQRIN
jgi:hypothetical protein